MNTQDSVFSGWIDELVVWVTVISIALMASYLLPRSVTDDKTERLCISCSWGLLGLLSGMAIILLFGWIFLITLNIKTPLWLLWQPAYMLSNLALSRALPTFVFIVTAWSLLGKWTVGYGMRTVWWALFCVAMLGINEMLLGLYSD